MHHSSLKSFSLRATGWILFLGYVALGLTGSACASYVLDEEDDHARYLLFWTKHNTKERMPHLIEIEEENQSIGHGIQPWDYMPFNPDNLLAKPAKPASLRITANYPRLDGAIAMLPIYGAIAQATYVPDNNTEMHNVVDCHNTSLAYTFLAEGKIDIFFGLEPSPAQIQYARSQGKELVATPIAREAFVFFVNKDNPVTSLQPWQLRDIYTTNYRIRNWQEVGGPDAPILAFQRPPDSGSQTIMEQVIIRDYSMAAPLREELMMGMGDIIMATAAYRNRLNALGYSFRWYATVQYSNPDIRLLAIDGVEPTVENIGNYSYPFTVPVVAVTARPLGQEGPYLSEECQQLLDWILGPEGQDLIERVGYVPLGSSPS